MDLSHNNTGYFPAMPVCDKHLSTELNSDFTLPDYQSEIKRLLSTRVTLSSPNEYVGNSNAMAEGALTYRVIYLGVDGKLYCATLEDKYSFSAPLEFTADFVNTDDVTLLPLCSAESVNTKVLGPRKLNVRARLSCRMLALSPSLHSTSIGGTYDPKSIEYLYGDTPCIQVKRFKSEPISLSDFIPLDPQIDNVRIIDSACSLQISECIGSSVRGDANIKIFYCNDAQSSLPLSTSRKLSFTSEIPADTDRDCDRAARGFVEDMRIDVSDSGISIELLICVCVEMQKAQSVRYTLDAYSIESACEGKSETVRVLEPITSQNSALTQNEVFSLDEIKLSRDAKIVDAYAKPQISEVALEHGKVFLIGKTDYQIIYHHDGEYASASLSSPVRYEVKLNSAVNEGDKIRWLACCDVVSLRTRCDGERLFIDTELEFNCIMQRENEISVLCELVLGERVSKPDGEIVLCYPKIGDTIWNVAKKYKKSVRELKSINSIADSETVVKSKYLVV